MADRLRLFTLGGLQIWLADQPLAGFETHKAAALLVYLACSQRPPSREVLAGLLWEDLSQPQAQNNLRVALAGLRKQLGDLLISDHTSVALDPHAEVWVDALQLEEALASWRAARGIPSRQSAGQLARAIDLYQGEFLQGFYVHEARNFEEWLTRERQRLQLLMIDALGDLVDYEIQEQDYPSGLEHAERLVALDPLAEAARCRMMLLLVGSGRRGEALAQYDILRRLLADELGVEPAVSTRALYEQIRAGEIAGLPAAQKQLRGYHLLGLLGAGCMGAVYRARQPFVDRQVAIKVILPELANQPGFIRRFESEARLVAQLEHPHIVPLYDYWRDPQGACLVMRLMSGGSLEDRLQAGALPLVEVDRVLEQVGSALQAAHRKGVVHRDIKPANILLDEDGDAYLSDFGIARALEAPAAGISSPGVSTPGVSTPAYITPEQVQGGPVTPQTDIYALGLVLYVMLCGQHPFPDSTDEQLLAHHLHDPFPSLLERHPGLPPGLDSVIQTATAKCAQERFPDVQAMLAAFQDAVGVSLEAGRPALVGANPYKGLRAFEQADADDFYGREALTKQLLVRLGEAGEYSRFLALVGPSGCGKSSAVKAGLLPALRRGALPGSQDWYILEMAPHNHPLDELEIALMRVNTDPGVNLAGQLHRDERGLLRAARLALPGGEGRLLLVVDQFEEVFTLAEDREEARHFMDLLYSAVTEADSPLRVLVTLRADFYDRPLMERNFAALVQQRTEVVVPLTAEELERAIRYPAGRAGVAFGEGLESEIVAEVLDQPGALPLLQYALTELFERREGRQLTRAAYQAIGGVPGALGGRAEQVYQGLDESQKALARQVFLRLVSLGEGVEDTRRRLLQSELEALDGFAPASSFPSGKGEERGLGPLTSVLSAFGRARLLTFDRDPLTRGPTVEVAHEALLREWPRLAGWLDESRADIRLQRLLAGDVAEWERSGREASYLLRGGRLAGFEAWLQGSSLALTGEERAYLQASREAEAVRLAREAVLERRWRVFLWGLVAVLAVATLVAFGLTVLARRAQHQALAEADARATQQSIAEGEARARATQQSIAESASAEADRQRQSALLQASAGLAARALAELDTTQPDRAVLLSLEALEHYPYTPQAESALAHAVQSVPPYRDFVVPWINWTAAAWSPSGDRLAIAYTVTKDSYGYITIQDAQTFEELNRIYTHPSCKGDMDVDLAWSPHGDRLATVPYATYCPPAIYDARTGGLLTILAGQPGQAADSVVWSPDGGALLTGSLDGVVRLWDAASGEIRQEFPGHTGIVREVAWSPGGDYFASAGQDGTVRVWEAASGKTSLVLTGSAGDVQALAWSPDGSQLASAGADSLVRLWDLATALSSGASSPVIAGIPTSPTEVKPVVGFLTTNDAIHTLRGHNDRVDDLAWSADGIWIASSSLDGTLRVWDAASELEVYRLKPNGFPYSKTLAWSPQGDLVVLGSAGPRVWDLSHRPLRLSGHLTGFYDAQWSPDGKYIATTSWDKTLKFWDAPRGKLLKSIDFPANVEYLAWSPDGSRLVTSSRDGTLRVVSAPSGEILSEKQRTLETRYYTFAWSPDGTRILASTADFRTAILDPVSLEELLVVEGGLDCYQHIRPGSWSPSGERFVTGCFETNLGISPAWDWDAVTGERLLELPSQSKETTGAIYSPDGRYIATYYVDGGAKVWEASTGKPVSTFAGHTGLLIDLHWSPDSKRLVSIDFVNNMVRVWEAATGQEIYSFPSPVNGQSVDWSPDGKYVLATGVIDPEPLVRRVWQSTSDLIAYARECCVWRQLTPEERAQFGLPDR